MSHSHRDEHDLVSAVADDAAPVVVTPPAPVVSNSEAERRAEERRKADGITEQTTQHQFTGELPEPDRGGSETESRLVFGQGGADDDATPGTPAAVSRRGPPPPRALHAEDEGSWATPPMLDALGAGSLAVASESWLAPPARPDAAALGPVTRSWIRRPAGG